MNYNQRLIRLTVFFGFLMVLLMGMLAYRMLWQGSSLSGRAILTSPLMAKIQSLAREGIIQPDTGGVVIDRERLEKRVPGPGMREFILNRQRFMSFDGDTLEVDPTALLVTDRRRIRKGVTLSRGRILDRNGLVLAETLKEDGGSVRRDYPLGMAALPLLGVVSPVYGLKGLERSLSPFLEGEVDEGPWSWLYRFFSGKKEAYDVVLTIDGTLQEAAFKALEGQKGAAVVVDVKTGEILAAAGRPSFDPHTPPGPAWDHAATLGYKGPFVNRALQRRYPPGSTFKLVTAAAWMEQPDYNPKWGLKCRGRHPRYGIREFRGKHHGWVSLKTAVRLSCNVFFAEAGVRLGPELSDWADRFGFNRKWSLFEGDSPEGTIVASRAFQGHPSIRSGGKWENIDFTRNPKLVAQGAVGQNVVSATPLQMAMVGATLANGGKFMAPRLVKEIKYVQADDDGTSGWINFRTIKAQELGTVCSQKTAQALLAMMADVVDKGTGHGLKRLYLKNDTYCSGPKLPKGCRNVLAGKTGTAETEKGKPDHSWFLAVAPMDEPRYAVVVIAEYGGLGAKTAGPIAVEIMQATLNREKGQKPHEKDA